MITYIGQDSSAAKRITHKKCGAIIEYNDVDVKQLYRGTDWGGGAYGADGFAYPKCAENVIVRSF